MSRNGLILDTGARHPHFNMALDDVLLDSHEPGGFVLRTYGWEPWGLSIGYFQAVTREEIARYESAGLVATRRLTGGGAIVHARELTYSIVADAPSGPGSSRFLYSAVNRAISSALRRFGVDATERGGEAGAFGNSFMCFDRHADFDVAVKGRKIAGSAQRRRGGAILQHGSVILEPPPFHGESLAAASPEAGRTVGYGEFGRAFLNEAAGCFGIGLREAALSGPLVEKAQRLAAEKYSSEAWIYKKKTG